MPFGASTEISRNRVRPGCAPRRFGAPSILLLSSVLLCLLCIFGTSALGVRPAYADQSTAQQSIPTDVASSRIAVMEGSVGEKYAAEHWPDAEVMDFPSYNDAATALQSDQVTYVILSRAIAIGYCRNDPDLAYVKEPLTDESYAFVFKKGNTLRDQVNTVLDRMLEDGTVDQIISNWIREDGSDYVVTTVPKVDDGPVLKVACAADREPICFIRNGEYAGLDVEIIERVAYELGMTVEFEDMKFSSEIPAVQSGQADVAMSLTATAERALSVDFSTEYFPNPQVLLYKQAEASSTSDSSSSSSSSWWETISSDFYRTLIEENRWQLVLSGLGVTLLISIAALVFGTLLGAFICVLRRSRWKVLRGIARVYIALIQGVPIVILLMILYYIVFAHTGLAGVAVAVIGFSLYFAAYAAEAFRSGLASIDDVQLESAEALGFGRHQAFALVVLPQAIRSMLPVFKGEFITIVKMTSIVGYIAIQDLTKVSDIIRSRTYEAFFPLIMTAVIYFLLTWLVICLIRALEHLLDPSRRKRGLKGVTLR